MPLRLYVANYDRAFRAHDEAREDPFYEPLEFWAERWTDNDAIRLEELRDERRDDEARRGVYEDDEMGRVMREIREQEHARLHNRVLLDQRPGPYDRPGAAEPPFDSDFLARVGLPDPGRSDDYELPGHFWLPLPNERAPGERWEDAVRNQMTEMRSRWKALPAFFDDPLALDIAIEGAASGMWDIDNAAHAVLTAFEERYCAGRRGTVTGYRVYRRAGTRAGVRVMVMPSPRLDQLDRAIEVARDRVVEEPFPD